MKTLLKSLLLTLCCFAGVAAHAAGTPDTQWTYKTINGKALKMDVLLPEGYASDEKHFPAIVFVNVKLKTRTPDTRHTMYIEDVEGVIER